MESNTIVTLKKGEGRTIKSGGLWIFDNEIAKIEGRFSNGDVVRVEDFDGYPMGKGYINQNSKIRVRMLTRDAKQSLDEEFFRTLVKRAWDYRKNVMECGNEMAAYKGKLDADSISPFIGNTNRLDLDCTRVIFGEADYLPGITIDKYADVLVMEALTLGSESVLLGDEPLKTTIARLLVETLEADGISIRAVYERNDAKERIKEGLDRYKGLLWHREGIDDSNFDPHVEIVENGVRYIVDVRDGQKTGFFLDQKYNRLAMQRLCEGKKVLDCFTHMGTFALNAGIAGAADVTGLDISELAVQQATDNAALNGLSDTVHFRCANVLDELPKLAAAGEKYDVVILDPPAFTKSKEATKNAIKGYREINMKGLRLVKPGGYFATCSCSHFMTEELFKKTIKEATKSTHKKLRQIEFRTQSADHPIQWSASTNTPESYYLKFLIFQVVE